MPSLCCFLHPAGASEPRELTDLCPECGLEYGFPLKKFPFKVGSVTVERSLNRGFYGAAYVGTVPPFGSQKVIKLVPEAIYDFFGKDFKKECEEHHKLATSSSLIANITNYGKETLTFGDEEITCHFAELEYIAGPTLEQILESNDFIEASVIAQIAIDLYSLLIELQRAELHHNDLHAGNIIIEQLSTASYRADAIDQSIRVRAIDLGSISDQNGSIPEKQRIGDVRWVARHVDALCRKILLNPDAYNESDYQLADLLSNRCEMLDHSEPNQRRPSYEQLIDEIRHAVVTPVERPWLADFKLNRFEDSYNAQTLNSWHVPSLLVDPDESWLKRLSITGPQLITGMRGCGKTIVLRSADFHARAAKLKGSSFEEANANLKEETFVGLYCSATRLLGNSEKMFERLLIAYSRAAIQSIAHLEDVTGKKFSINAARAISGALRSLISPLPWDDDIFSLETLERKLRSLQAEVTNPDQNITLKNHPSEAFQSLADAIRESNESWANSYILFLLDDVSTRYLSEDHVRTLVSELLFQSDKCAFKFTTESQTLELVLKAPGQNSAAWNGRDYQVFDLGYEVNNSLKNKSSLSNGEDFLVSVLKQRARHYSLRPAYDPASILGDVPLEIIAREIAATGKNDAKKKSVYRGLSALRGVCVGDVGDAILLYDEMLRRGDSEIKKSGGANEIPAKIQSEVFQNHCSRKLYDLNRRDSFLKDVSLSFARASKLLLDYSEKARKNNPKLRLRQYTKIYVQISDDNLPEQFSSLRKLIDAGVFVLEGGTETPRTKTRDSDPITQFKLSFRKLFGMSNFMPISDRDRFELSRQPLQDWLSMKSPEQGAEVLIANLTANQSEPEEEFDEEQIEDVVKKPEKGAPSAKRARLQPELDLEYQPTNGNELVPITEPPYTAALQRLPDFISCNILDALNNESPPKTLILGLGFEERCLESLRSYIGSSTFERIICFEYKELGKKAQMMKLLKKTSAEITTIKWHSKVDISDMGLPGDVMIDITGLSTPIIFSCVRTLYRKKSKVLITHGFAKEYYPSNESISAVIDADKKSDAFTLLEKLGDLWSGEDKPYKLVELISPSGDVLRERALCAFVGAKHERLFTLLEEREADVVYLAIPNKGTARCKLAEIAAEIAAKGKDRSSISHVDSSNASSAAIWLTKAYGELMLHEGASVEVGLAGAKGHVVASAIVSSVVKLAACWYVQPSYFDPKKFTSGYENNHSYWISSKAQPDLAQ